MKVDAVIGNKKRIVVTMIAVASVITLLVFSSAVIEVRAPIESSFGGPGYVYSAEYQCGNQSTANDPKAQPGKYSTNILIHNPFTEEQAVFIKILPVTGKPLGSEWLNKTSIITEPWIIGSDSVLSIDCKDITTVAGDPNKLSSIFSKGLLIISHPVKVDDTNVLIQQPLFGDESLDVTASYTYLSSENVKDKNCNKVIAKVKDKSPDGRLTNKVYQLLVETDPAAPLINMKGKVKDAITTQGIDVSGGFKIIEVTKANCAAPTITTVGQQQEQQNQQKQQQKQQQQQQQQQIVILSTVGGGVGASKNVETIKGKFVPFIPVPEEIRFIT